MNIKELESKDLDLVKWNTLLDKTPVLDAQYCQHWFVSSICNSWKAYILDDYKSAFICVYSKKKGVKIMYQPFYSRNFSFIGEANNKFVNTVIKKIENEFKLLQFNLSDNIKLKLWEKTELNYQILPLNSSYDNIYKTYSKNAKRILKKNNNILISESNKSKDFILLFKEKVGYKLKFTDENYMFLLNIHSFIQNHDQLTNKNMNIKVIRRTKTVTTSNKPNQKSKMPAAQSSDPSSPSPAAAAFTLPIPMVMNM